MNFSYEKAEKRLRKELDAGRFRHTMGVTYTAACLAMVHGCELEKARIAGLLHDCAKCIPNPKKLSMCAKAGIVVTVLNAKILFYCMRNWGPMWRKRSTKSKIRIF